MPTNRYFFSLCFMTTDLTSSRSTFCTELHFSGELLFSILRIVPYLSKLLQSNRIKKVPDTPIYIYRNSFAKANKENVWKIRDTTQFLHYLYFMWPSGYAKGLRSHRYRLYIFIYTFLFLLSIPETIQKTTYFQKIGPPFQKIFVILPW